MARRTMPVTGSHGPKLHGWPALIPHLPPWLAWALLPVAASLARAYWATGITSAVLATAGMVVVFGALTGFTWHAFRARGHSIRVHATISMAAAGIWLVAAVAVGFRTKAVWSVWLLGGIGLCVAWTLRRIARGDGHDHHDDSGQKILEAVDLAGARFGRPKVIGAKVSAPLQLVRGEHTTADAQAIARRLDSKLGLRRGATRIIENDEDESRPHVEIVPRDPLVKPIPWRGPDAPGESIAEKISFGTYDDSSRAGLWLPGATKPVRVSAHLRVAGMTGAGKTETGLVICTNILTRCDASLIYVDSVKGIQSIAPIINGVDLPIIDRPTAVAFLKRLPHVIRARTEWLGQHGFKQWQPGCGLKYLVVHIEESADLIADSVTFTKITEQARSAGITLVCSQQRWTHDRVDTSARANFGAGLCFGVDNEDSARVVLSEETMDANVAPWSWKNMKPGYFLLEAPGVDPRLWPVPARADLAEAEHLTEAVAEFATPGLDPTTALAVGDLYATHASKVAEGKAPWQKPVKTATRMPAAVDDLDDDIDDLDDDEDAVDDYEYEVPENPEPGFMDDIDPEQDIPDDDDNVIAIGLPINDTKMGRTEAVNELRREIESRIAAGMETVRPSELVDLRVRIGRSASWLTQQLQEFVDEGLLIEDPDFGVYGLPVPVPA